VCPTDQPLHVGQLAVLLAHLAAGPLTWLLAYSVTGVPVHTRHIPVPGLTLGPSPSLTEKGASGQAREEKAASVCMLYRYTIRKQSIPS